MRSPRLREPLRVRAPATTANLGPGFDCAAVALDLWNELEVSPLEQAPDLAPDRDHLGVRAFARVASPEGLAFRWTSRIPRERGLGSSAAVIALGLVAASLLEHGHGDYGELFAHGLELEGHGDNLAAALAGGVCLTWEERIVRVADAPPAVPIAVVPETTVSTAAARAALPESIPHADAAFSAGRATLLGRRTRGPRARALPRDECAAPRRDPRGAPGRGARRDALGLRADGDRVGPGGRRRRLHRRARGALSR
jgi:homoserine kinase